jgi:hypothetical protein
MATGVGFWECGAVAWKMSTFVSGKKAFDSRLYVDFMSTFVYRPEAVSLVKSTT